jgi:hypothetical protein
MDYLRYCVPALILVQELDHRGDDPPQRKPIANFRGRIRKLRKLGKLELSSSGFRSATTTRSGHLALTRS